MLRQIPRDGCDDVLGAFLKRLTQRARAPRQDRTVAVSDDYVLARLHADDLDHFLISLAALLNGADAPADHTSEPT
jgi:hypothetical protein